MEAAAVGRAVRLQDRGVVRPVIRRFSSGTAWEPVVGYSRAVAAGDFVFVSGCTSVAGAKLVHPGDAYAQAGQAIRNAAAALAGLGASIADVVQTRMYLTDISRWEEVSRAHAEAFGDVRPAATMVEVAALIDPALLVEVEVVAYRPGIGELRQAPNAARAAAAPGLASSQ
jgi:enamine deaminase RidA (YjgF/YER057c/UK114 family)